MYIHNIAITYQYCRYFSVLPLRISNGNFDMGSGLIAKLCPTLATLWTVPCQAPLSMGFSRQECWIG